MLLNSRTRHQIIQSILTAAITNKMNHLNSVAYSWLIHIELFHTYQDHKEFCQAYEASGQFKGDLFRAKYQGSLLVDATPKESSLYALQEQNAEMMSEILFALGDKPEVLRVHQDDCPKYCTSCGQPPFYEGRSLHT